MSARDKVLPFHLLFFLVVCIGSLTFHFAVEGIAGSTLFFLDVCEQGEHSHLDNEDGEDQFTFPRLTSIDLENAEYPADREICSAAVCTVPPLLPPPNN